jgi:hypothetical protein
MIPAGTGFKKYRSMRIKRDLLADIDKESDSAVLEESRAAK